MEAKDTVMDYEQKKLHGGYDPLKQAYVSVVDIINIQQKLCGAQAEITWPIAKQAGIREVVEWIERHCCHPYGNDNKRIQECEWQSKLKEWGVKE